MSEGYKINLWFFLQSKANNWKWEQEEKEEAVFKTFISHKKSFVKLLVYLLTK